MVLSLYIFGLWIPYCSRVVGHDRIAGAKESIESFIVEASGPWFCDEAEATCSIGVDDPEH
jgi:hypothetical protein